MWKIIIAKEVRHGRLLCLALIKDSNYYIDSWLIIINYIKTDSNKLQQTLSLLSKSAIQGADVKLINMFVKGK